MSVGGYAHHDENDNALEFPAKRNDGQKQRERTSGRAKGEPGTKQNAQNFKSASFLTSRVKKTPTPQNFVPGFTVSFDVCQLVTAHVHHSHQAKVLNTNRKNAYKCRISNGDLTMGKQRSQPEPQGVAAKARGLFGALASTLLTSTAGVFLAALLVWAGTGIYLLASGRAH